MSDMMTTIVPMSPPAEYSELYLKYRDLLFTTDKPPSEPKPFIQVNGHIAASLGNVFVLSGLPKTGKTSVCAGILGGSLTVSDKQIDTLGLTISKNTAKGEVAYISTELSEDDFDRFVRKVLVRSNLTSKPSFFHSLNLAGYRADQLKDIALEFIDDLGRTSKNGIQLILIDGVADFVFNVNDPGPSTEIIQILMSVARRFNAAVGVVIHKNPGNSSDAKMRGHLGSELSRRGVGTLVLTRKKGYVEISGKDFRGGSEDFQPIRIIYDESKGYFVYYGPGTGPELGQKEKKMDAEIAALRLIFQEKTSFTYGDLVKQLILALRREIRTVKGRISSYVEKGILKKNDDGTYSLTQPM